MKYELLEKVKFFSQKNKNKKRQKGSSRSDFYIPNSQKSIRIHKIQTNS